MPARASVAAAFLSAFALFPHGSVAADSPIVITQTKAAAGGVTPGDTAGFPVTISQPGSYVLGSHLLPPSNKNGILVTADFVDIDMNGFRLYGGNVAGYGVYVQGKSFGKIHDGTIANFKYDGIRILSPGNAWTVENMQIVRNSSGIYADPSLYMRILSNSVLLNVNHGIYCGNSCHVEGNTSSDNGQIGIRALTGTVLGNTVYSNGFFGILGANTGFGNNTLVGNRANGPAGTPSQRRRGFAPEYLFADPLLGAGDHLELQGCRQFRVRRCCSPSSLSLPRARSRPDDTSPTIAEQHLDCRRWWQYSCFAWDT